MEDLNILEEELQHYDTDDLDDFDYEDFDEDEEFDIDVDVDDDESEELQHHGTKGMKWGVRRFQNKDGSLTPAGRKRYGSLTDAVGAVKAYHIKQKRKKNLAKAREAAAEKKRIEAEQKAAAEQRKKDVADGKVSARNMTAEELQSRIDKLNLEKQYKQLMDETNPNSQVTSRGKEIVRKFIDEAVVPAAVAAGKDALTTKFTEQAKKQLGLTDDDLDSLKKMSATLKEKADIAKYKENIAKSDKNAYDDEKKLNEVKKKDAEEEGARIKEEAQKQVDEYNEKLYKDEKQSAPYRMRGKDVVDNKQYTSTESTAPPRANYDLKNPPAVYEKAVTSMSNVSTNSKEYSDMADRGEEIVYNEVLDRDGNIITRIKHSEIFGEDLAHWGIVE